MKFIVEVPIAKKDVAAVVHCTRRVELVHRCDGCPQENEDCWGAERSTDWADNLINSQIAEQAKEKGLL